MIKNYGESAITRSAEVSALGKTVSLVQVKGERTVGVWRVDGSRQTRLPARELVLEFGMEAQGWALFLAEVEQGMGE